MMLGRCVMACVSVQPLPRCAAMPNDRQERRSQYDVLTPLPGWRQCCCVCAHDKLFRPLSFSRNLMNMIDLPNSLGTGVIFWSDAFLLGYPPLDEVHEKFVECVSSLQIAADEQVSSCLELLAAHAKHHFMQEDRWMVETGFPPRDCHMEEHAAVYESITQVQQQVAQGDLAEARRLAYALAQWFPRHADHLDSALSHWICKQRWSGKPVVLRRQVAMRV